MLNSYQYIMLSGAREIKDYLEYDTHVDKNVKEHVNSYLEKIIRELSKLQN